MITDTSVALKVGDLRDCLRPPGSAGIADDIRVPVREFRWRAMGPTRAGAVLREPHPGDGEVFCEIPRSGEADVEKALDAAHAAAPGWARLSPADRALILNRVADRMEANLEAIAVAESWDNGKPIRETVNADIRWPSITSGTLRVCFAHKRVRSRRSMRTPLRIISMSRSALSDRSSRGIFRC